MGKKLSKQFEERGIGPQEVITYTDLFGKSGAMDYYKVKDWVAFNRYLREVAGTDLIGTIPKIPIKFDTDGEPDLRPLIYQLGEQIKQRIFNLVEKAGKQQKRIDHLEQQLRLYRLRDYEQFADAFKSLYPFLNMPKREISSFEAEIELVGEITKGGDGL